MSEWTDSYASSKASLDQVIAQLSPLLGSLEPAEATLFVKGAFNEMNVDAGSWKMLAAVALVELAQHRTEVPHV